MNFLKNIWGSNQSRGFKVGAWVAAIGAFSAWQFLNPSAVPQKKVVKK